ncbi:hypothetical protein DPMN_137558 [Dreissena polymorpha]|uniref:Uncharacterized protein n=1 Tax=Dreissena polymorpha TaxID=45954 RepID=A0A9D4JIY0_DREPO|nr:hypothetical protein DPMN_137558 [Dreissena polymorpha]
MRGRGYIIGTNLLTKFHEDRKINVASRVLTRKNALPPGSHVFQPTGIIFVLIQDIIGMNLLTKKNASPLGSQFFQANIIIFELIQDIIETNLLTKFHEDWTINVASRVLTRFYYSHIWPYKEKWPAPGGHVFKATKPIFELIQDIIGTNLLTKFHDDRKIIVTSRVLTRKNSPPLGSHVFQAKVTIFELIKDISGTNLLSKFHEDRKINVASRVLTRKNALPPGGHVFQPTVIIFELVQDIIKMNFLTKFHEGQTINVASRVKNAPPLGSHVFQAKVTIFELIQDINVASRVLTRKNAPSPGGHVFQPTGIILELIQDIIGMNLLTKFYEDQTITVASRVKNSPPLGSHVFQANANVDAAQRTTEDGQKEITKAHHEQVSPATYALIEDGCKLDG